MLSSGHDTEIALMNSQWLGLHAQDLHKTESVKIPAEMDKSEVSSSIKKK